MKDPWKEPLWAKMIDVMLPLTWGLALLWILVMAGLSVYLVLHFGPDVLDYLVENGMQVIWCGMEGCK